MKWELLIVLLTAWAVAASAAADEAHELRVRKAAHERASEVARQLIVVVLDAQLRQLEENGLQDGSAYHDIRSVRSHVEDLLAGEMRELTSLLVTAPSLPAVDQARYLEQVRALSRRVAIQLLAERRRLRERLNRPDAADREAMSRAVREVRQDQQRLREQTHNSELPAADRAALSDSQREIAEQLESIQPTLAELIQAGEQTLAAGDAAKAAQRHLAAGEKPLAVERQETVLRLLDEMVGQLSQEPRDPEQLAEEAMRLEELGRSLDQLLGQQAEAAAVAGDDPQRAGKIESEVAASLQAADDASDLGQSVESRLDQAQAAVGDAQQTLEDASASAAEREQATEAAERALMEAAAEVQSQLAGVQQNMEAAEPSDSMVAADGNSSNQSSSGTARDLGANGGAGPDEQLTSRGFAEEPWFTRLPPALQSAILARTRRPPPRGYEEQLRRYFQSPDRK